MLRDGGSGGLEEARALNAILSRDAEEERCGDPGDALHVLRGEAIPGESLENGLEEDGLVAAEVEGDALEV